MSPAANLEPAPSAHVLNKTQWRMSRKLKDRQRNDNRRVAEVSCLKSEGDIGRLTKLQTPTKTERRKIPEKLWRKGKHAVFFIPPSETIQSMPAATSWPPTMTSTDKFGQAINSIPLASSVPSVIYSRRLDNQRRELTLFESARIFNELGQLISHDTFDDLGSSPDLTRESTTKRKSKRRVGRHKYVSERSNGVIALTPDDVVLELMCLLLPNIEVTQEMNLLLLGGAQHEHVFHFDDEDMSNASMPNTGVLDIDVLKFQAALTSMLFTPSVSMQDMPARGTNAKMLQEMYLTPHWIMREMLIMVKLDVLAQYDRFAVVKAIFRTIPPMRKSILAAAASVSLAVFEHQNLEAISIDSDKTFVSLAGIIAFLSAAVDILQQDVRYNAKVFGSNENEIAKDHLYSQIMRAIRLLVRSSPGGNGSNWNNLEKYTNYSDSAEATTFNAVGKLVNRIAASSPVHGEEFLRWMLVKWPQRNIQLQLGFLRLIAGLLSQFMQLGLVLPTDVVRRTFIRLQASIQSTHFLVAQEACTTCGNFHLMSVYLSCNQSLREMIASTLHKNALSHWNKHIRKISDECFDVLLDLA